MVVAGAIISYFERPLNTKAFCRSLTELKNVCACVRLTLSGAFSIVWSMKVYSLERCCSCGWFPGDYHFWQFTWTNGNVARESQHNNVNISVNTSCIELCTKTILSQVAHPLNFSKNNFLLLKARSNSYLFTANLAFSLFSCNTLIILKEPTFDAPGQWRSHLRFSALLCLLGLVFEEHAFFHTSHHELFKVQLMPDILWIYIKSFSCSVMKLTRLEIS